MTEIMSAEEFYMKIVDAIQDGTSGEFKVKLIKQRDQAIRQSEREKCRELYEALGQIMDDMSPKDMSFPDHGCCEAAWDMGVKALTNYESENSHE